MHLLLRLMLRAVLRRLLRLLLPAGRAGKGGGGSAPRSRRCAADHRHGIHSRRNGTLEQDTCAQQGQEWRKMLSLPQTPIRLCLIMTTTCIKNQEVCRSILENSGQHQV